MKCKSCNAMIRDLSWYPGSETQGPKYFIAKVIRGMGYYDPVEDIPFCGCQCRHNYDDDNK